MESVLLDAAGHRRSPARMPGYHRGRPPCTAQIRPDARFRFVNVAQIEDDDAWRAALSDPDFPGRDMPGQRYPRPYEMVADVDHVVADL